MIKRILICIGLDVLSLNAIAEIARGTVFVDSNENGLLDSGEIGVTDVRVSNGTEIVLTGPDGRYEIAIDDEAILFITKPKNYATPVNGHMLPQFYYIHQPKGSPPGLRYQGITPTGPLPEEINFALLPRPEEKKFEALLFADTQPQTNRPPLFGAAWTCLTKKMNKINNISAIENFVE